MYEIKCPNCGEVFQVEKAAYAEIVEQVRNEQFQADLDERVKAVREKMEAEQETALSKQEQKLQKKIDEKDQEIFRLQEQAKERVPQQEQLLVRQEHPPSSLVPFPLAGAEAEFRP